MNKKKITDERLFLFCLLTTLIAFFTQLREIPQTGRIYPMILLIVAMVLCIYIIVFKAAEQSAEERITKRQVLDCLILGVMVLLYILIQNTVGYIIASLLFLYSTLIFLGLKENKFLLFLYPIFTTLIIYFLFNKILHVLLPEGFLITLTF